MKAESRRSAVSGFPRHSFVYGPVPSRRLGFSLGINIIPFKTCTVDCVYCQCGRTTVKTMERCAFFPISNVMAAVRSAIGRSSVGNLRSGISFLTFSGEGEPTLNKDIGRIIRRFKHEFSIPVAVITNSTLLTDPQVRRDLYAADLVVPSLDAADQNTFIKVNRCHRDLSVKAVIEGLRLFRRGFGGRIWLEIMLVKGINDSVEHVVSLREVAWTIKPDRVQINTVARPPAEKFAEPMALDDLKQIQCLFGPNTDIIGETKDRRPRTKDPGQVRPDAAILATVRGRPVTKLDLVCSLGVAPQDVEAGLRRLLRAKLIRRFNYSAKVFYEPP